MVPLGLLSVGEQAEVVEIKTYRALQIFDCHNERKKNEVCRMENMGIRAGKTVEMLNNEGRGPLLLKVDDSRIAIGRGMAMKVMVKKE